jgi:hypothetical protein
MIILKEFMKLFEINEWKWKEQLYCFVFKFYSYFSTCVTMKFLEPTLLTLDNHIVRPISKIKKYF